MIQSVIIWISTVILGGIIVIVFLLGVKQQVFNSRQLGRHEEIQFEMDIQELREDILDICEHVRILHHERLDQEKEQKRRENREGN